MIKRSSTNWRKKFRRRLAACAIGGSTALSSAACYAANAFDNASDPVYADGWQAGDNGGFGFTPWNFDAGYIFRGTNYQYSHPGVKMIDDGLKAGTQFSNPFNDIGRAWTIITTPADNGAPHVGRGFSPLQINQTLSVVFDNPTKRQFFKGYFIRLNGGTGGINGNICNPGTVACSYPSGSPQREMGWDRFEYSNAGAWTVDDAAHNNVAVLDSDTAAAGALFQVTRTGDDTYDLKIDSFGPGADYSASRTFANPGFPIDWIEFVQFNPVSDTGTPPTTATDFYIRSMEITAAAPPQWKVDSNGSWGDANNWTNGTVPDGDDAVANFLGAITAPRTVTMDGFRRVRAIDFNNANSYTISGGSGDILIVGDTGAGLVSSEAGSHVIDAKVLFAGATNVDISTGSALSLSGGIGIGVTQTVTKFGGGLLSIGGPQSHEFGSSLVVTQGTVALNSDAGAAGTSGSPANANLSITVGDEEATVKLGASQNLSSLTIAYSNGGAQGVDLASNSAEFHSISIYSGDLDAARASMWAAVLNARTSPGDGIFDSGLHANAAIGVAKLVDPHGDQYVYIRPTRNGDLNLDGSVTIADFIDLAGHFNQSGTWQEGDINGDGFVTIGDFIDLAANFNMSYAGGSLPISAADQQILLEFAAAHGASSVPEPGALCIFLAGASLLGRRRRRGRREL